MNRANESGAVEKLVNTVMGVKANGPEPSENKRNFSATEPDFQALLVYSLGTVLQVGLILLAFWAMEQLTAKLASYGNLPSWSAMLLAVMFFALLSIRSRVFSVLDNTRSRQTYDDVIRPRWAPPPLAFPIVWMTIAVLRVIAALLVWQELNQQFLALPLIAFAVHLALGDTWNTIFTVERRLGAAVPVVIFGPWLSALVVAVLYWQVSTKAGMILAPSCIWLTVAAVLVLSIWQLNGKEPLYPLKSRSVEN